MPPNVECHRCPRWQSNAVAMVIETNLRAIGYDKMDTAMMIGASSRSLDQACTNQLEPK